MKDSSILLLGGLAVGGFLLYNTFVKPVANVTQGASDIVKAGEDAISKDITNFNNSLSGFGTTIQNNLLGSLSQIISQLNTNKTKDTSVPNTSNVGDNVNQLFQPPSQQLYGDSSSPPISQTYATTPQTNESTKGLTIGQIYGTSGLGALRDYLAKNP